MSHGDRLEQSPPGFVLLGRSESSPLAMIGDLQKRIFGVQFHPEVRHTPGGKELLRRFVVDVCGAKPDWTLESIIHDAVERIRTLWVRCANGSRQRGVDSSVATALVNRAIGDQLPAVFVDHGLLRLGEREQWKRLPAQSGTGWWWWCLRRLHGCAGGVTDPEQKRRIIGEKFIRIFEAEARKAGSPRFLVQGTIYPDVVESSAPDRSKAQRIKTHHNVGGLPKDMQFSLVEPLRYLFKDEVRAVGEAWACRPNGLAPAFPAPAGRALPAWITLTVDKLRPPTLIFTYELWRGRLLKPRHG
jgi:GMP synthase (glutamine-hydrolysing)